MMDVKDLLNSNNYVVGNDVELTGWLVDQKDGLFLLGDHYPENYGYEYRIKISNSDIIYQILKIVPSLGGGWSLLFYKAKIFGTLNKIGEIRTKEIFVQSDRCTNVLQPIDIKEETIAALVSKHGSYKFGHSKNPMRDWLNDVD